MIRISKDMLLEDILSIRGSIPPDNEEARDKLDKLVSFLSTYPLDENVLDESMINKNPIKDGNLTAVIRIGQDFQNNLVFLSKQHLLL